MPMRRWILFATLLLSALHGYENPRKFLPTLKKQPTVSYGKIVEKLHLFGRDAESGEPEEPIDYEFLNSAELYPDLTAVDPRLLRKEDLKYKGPSCLLAVYRPDDMGFNEFALLFDENGSLMEAALIGHRAGNSEWRVERTWRYEGFAHKNADPAFVVTDLRLDTEWFEPGLGGFHRLTGYRKFRLEADLTGCRFRHREIPLNEELREEDARLNRLYRTLMKKYDDTSRKTVRRIQRAWLDYVTRKCRFNPREDFAYETRCRLEETKRRADELQKLLQALP
jgi:hypothetical protein